MDRLKAVGTNAPQIEYWNGPAGDKWARLADSQDSMLDALGQVAMDACEIASGHAVLDVGCGSGSTSMEMAGRVAPGGSVLGVDISTPMLAVGLERLRERHVEGLTFENRDVSTYPFEASQFDRVFSRFGVMFFVDPAAAFANIRNSMKSGARLGFVCWKTLGENPLFKVPVDAALRHLSPPPPSNPEEPGPMAFADPDRVRRILSGAGFEDVGLQALETMLPLEADAPRSAEKLIQIGPSSRLLADAPDEIKQKVMADLTEDLKPYETPDGVKLGCAVWIVTASAP